MTGLWISGQPSKKPESCYLLGEYMEDPEQNYNESLKLFKENCEERQDGKTCFKHTSHLRAKRESTPNFENQLFYALNEMSYKKINTEEDLP
uniref:Uncharacterized protein n=1 Tax=Ditylenchus dipsaci TaxID=166011 RepID=A0A915CXG3_9BILA